MLLHEVVFTALCFVAALAQVAFMFLRPKQYNAARQYIVLANRCARLLLLLVGIAIVRPGLNKALVSNHLSLKAQHSQGAVGLGSSGHISPALPGLGPTLRPAVSSQELPGPQEPARMSYAAMLKWVVLEPVLLMMHANHIVSFRATAVLQLCTFCASAYKTLSSFLCVCMFVTDPTTAAAVQPACERLNWLVHAAEQLLDLQIPLLADELSVATDAVCAQPLVPLVVFHVWVRLVLLVLLPCTAVYCLERHLKGVFLRKIAHAADGAGRSEAEQQQSQLQAGASSNGNSSSGELSSRIAFEARVDAAGQHGSQQQQRALQQQPLSVQQLRRLREQQVLQAVQPAPAADLLLLASGCWLVRYCVSAGLALLAVISCWHVAELGVLAVLQRGQRTLVCDSQGWLRLA
jgi:hypothetical protein